MPRPAPRRLLGGRRLVRGSEVLEHDQGAGGLLEQPGRHARSIGNMGEGEHGLLPLQLGPLAERRKVAEIGERLIRDLSTLPDEFARDRVATLAWMLHDGMLDVRVAAPLGSDAVARTSAIFHSKRLIFRDEIAELCPELNMSLDVPYPIEAALYHPPGSVLRHDAVVWGYGSQFSMRGGHIHQGIRVTGIRKDQSGKCIGVDTNQGPIDAGIVMSAVAGWTTQVTDMAGVRTPITNHPLQAFVTEPVKPILHKIIVSASLHTYISQTDRGEILIGSEIEPYTTYNMRSTNTFLEHSTANALDVVPLLARLKIQRQWTGYCDMTPDYSPIMGFTDVDNFVIDAGWGTWGFKAPAVCGETMAELIATNRTPDLIEPFRLSRFMEESLVPEKAAASVSH